MAINFGAIIGNAQNKKNISKYGKDAFSEKKTEGYDELIKYDEWGLVFDGDVNLPILFNDDVKKKFASKEIDRFIRILNSIE